jgi:hypothetical protein
MWLKFPWMKVFFSFWHNFTMFGERNWENFGNFLLNFSKVSIPKKKKTLINMQPYSKENNIRDTNICSTKVKQPYQKYTMSTLTKVIVNQVDLEAANQTSKKENNHDTT